MKVRNVAIVASVAAIALGAVSCGDPDVSGHPTTPRSSDSNSHGNLEQTRPGSSGTTVPSVSEPLNIKHYLSQKGICYIISEEQANKIGIDRPKPTSTSDPYGPICSVTDRHGDNSVHIGMQKTLSLSAIYAKRENWSYFTPGEVRDYPIVVGDKDDDRKDGTCVVHIGVTNEVTSDVMYTDNTNKTGKSACNMAKKTASEVVQTLKNAK